MDVRKCAYCGGEFRPKFQRHRLCSCVCKRKLTARLAKESHERKKRERLRLPATRQRPCLRCRRPFTVPAGSGLFACPTCQEEESC